MMRLTIPEREWLATMQTLTGLASLDELLRLGLWHLAKHLDLPTSADVFAPRLAKGDPRGTARSVSRPGDRTLTDLRVRGAMPAPGSRRRRPARRRVVDV